MSENRDPLVYLVACEASGDQIGALLMESLRALTGERIRFAGVGGPAMAAQGLSSLFPIQELALLGVFEVLPKAGMILKRVRETVADIRAREPRVLVTIDSWGFTGRIHQRLARARSPIPRIRYVAPQVWAWRPGRAKQLARWIDHLFALLPFEPPYFSRVGLPTTWVGHPVVESGFSHGDGARFRKQSGIVGKPVIAVLPGSRPNEVTRLLPVFKDTITRLVARYPQLHVIVPTVDAVAHEVYAQTRESWAAPVTVVMDPAERRDAFAAADVALAASGTVSLELAMAGVPHVIAYRVNALSALAFRLLAKTKRVNLVNILVGHEAVPERLQGKCRAEILADDLSILLRDEPRRKAQIADFAAALGKLAPPGARPSRLAAEAILRLAKIAP